jgi:hypothetical protein
VFAIRLQSDADFVSAAGDNPLLVNGHKLIAVADQQVRQHADKGTMFPLPSIVSWNGKVQFGRGQSFDRAHNKLPPQ